MAIVAQKIDFDKVRKDKGWAPGDRLCCFKNAPAFLEVSTSRKLDQLKAKLADLEHQREQVAASGWQLEYKPEVYPTKKPNGKVFGNASTASGSKGYAYAVTFHDGKKHRKPIAPSQLGEFEAAHGRYLAVQKLNRQIAELVRQIDREVAIAAGQRSARTADATGKAVGDWDLHDTRENWPSGSYPHGQFSFVVFRWEARKTGTGVKRGRAIKKFPVSSLASPRQIEAIRQQAIAFIEDQKNAD